MMSGSYLTVAYGSHVSWQLLGVAFAAFQGGLGEASCLALCSFYDSRRALTLWSSGTGFAGSCVHSVPQPHMGHSKIKLLSFACAEDNTVFMGCTGRYLQNMHRQVQRQ